MKYNDNGTIKEIKVKSFDTLPVGAEVDYDGSVVPDGWTEVDNVEIITANDFFDSITSGLTVDEFYAYKIGNIVNISRVVIRGNYVSSPSETNIGYINEKYAPRLSSSIRLLGSSGGESINIVLFLNGTNKTLSSISSENSNQVYIFNTSYITRD